MQNSTAYFRIFKEDEPSESDSVIPGILCIDPDPEVRSRFSRLFEKNGYTVFTAQNPGEAMEIIVRSKPQIAITEIQYDNITAQDLLQSFRRLNRDMVIIIHTGQPERRTGKNRRLDYVFEYIVKPATSSEMIGHVKRALAFYKEKQRLKNLIDHTREKISQQLEWLMWMERTNIRRRLIFSKSIVDSIKHSITQGNGVGSLITYGEMLQVDKKDLGDRYSVSKGMIDGLMESTSVVRNWLDDMDSVSRSLAKEYELQVIEGHTLSAIVKETVESMDRFRRIKNHTVHTDDFAFTQPVISNDLVLKFSLRELLTNAFKFSPEGSVIKVGEHRTSNSVSILISNLMLESTSDLRGIPPEYESKIFEPFFRLSNIHDDRFQGEMYGMGTGLTIVQGAVNQVNGKVYVYEVREPEDDNRRAVAELIMPIVQNESDEQ
jgi:signal transduction histidine kinase